MHTLHELELCQRPRIFTLQHVLTLHELEVDDNAFRPSNTCIYCSRTRTVSITVHSYLATRAHCSRTKTVSVTMDSYLATRAHCSRTKTVSETIDLYLATREYCVNDCAFASCNACTLFYKRLFTDTTLCYYPTDSTKLQYDFRMLRCWGRSWEVPFNLEKHHKPTFTETTKQQPPPTPPQKKTTTKKQQQQTNNNNNHTHTQQQQKQQQKTTTTTHPPKTQTTTTITSNKK